MGLFHGGSEGIRTPDSVTYTRFRVVRLQPLGHASIPIILACLDILGKVCYNGMSKILELKIIRKG